MPNSSRATISNRNMHNSNESLSRPTSCIRPSYLDIINKWRTAQSQLDDAIQHYLQSAHDLSSIPPCAIEAVSVAETGGDNIWSDINNCMEAVSSRAQKLQEVTPMLGLIHNQSLSLVPINKLPLEILTQIFYLCAYKPESQWGSRFSCGSYHCHMSVLNGLSSVCSRWRALVVNKPSFWSHLNFSPDKRSTYDNPSWNLLQKSIERASRSSLCITVSGHRFTLSRNNTLPAFEVLRPVKDNIKHLCVRAYSRHQTLLSMFLANVNTCGIQTIALITSGMANRYSFEAFDNLNETSTLSEPKYESCLLSVRSLRLERTLLEWRSLAYRNLLSLTLDNISGQQSHPTVNNILSILLMSPELHTLRLRTPISPIDDVASLPTQVHLPAIVNLDLRRVGTGGLTQLLPRLAISSNRLIRSISLEVQTHPDSLCRVAIEEFLSRTTVTRLLLNSQSYPSRSRNFAEEQSASSALQGICSMAPYVTSLTLIGNPNLRLPKVMTRLGPANELQPCCPMLRSLDVISWKLNRKDIQTLSDAHPALNKMRIYGCNLPARPEFDNWLNNNIKWAKVVPMDPSLDLHSISQDYPDCGEE